MTMPGMPGGAHSVGVLNLLPTWLGLAWTVVFVGVALSHMRHMLQTTGQRRPWHACHVLMAVGMAAMYLPASVATLGVPTGLWKVVFAAAGLVAAVWAVGGVGRTATLVWLLTSIDLGVMLYMWSGSGRGGDAAVTWMLAGYLVVEGLAWGLDLYRRVDGAMPLVRWQLLTPDASGGAAVATAGSDASLLAVLDISASMVAMTLGMAYMLVAMQLAV